MSLRRDRGFTLIEVLVVIAIIGILSSVVVVALGNVREKAKDARIKSDVNQIRQLAEIYYDINGASYIGFKECAIDSANADPGYIPAPCAGGIEKPLSIILADVQKLRLGRIILTSDNYVTTKNDYCIAIASTANNMSELFCADTTSFSMKTVTSACSADAKCPAN